MIWEEIEILCEENVTFAKSSGLKGNKQPGNPILTRDAVLQSIVPFPVAYQWKF